jgi:hypothetical protein
VVVKNSVFHFWCWLAALVLLASMAVNVWTFMGIDPIRARWVFALHGLTLLAFAAGLVYAQRVEPDRKKLFRILLHAPKWAVVLSAVFFVYALVNSAISLRGGDLGFAEIRAGRFVLVNHGQIIRELSETEFRQRRAHGVRWFSALWMIFSCVGLTFLLATARAREEQVGAALPMASSE